MVRMLVTRPDPDASETAARLRALDIEPVIEPLLRFRPLPVSLPDPAGFETIVVTSANALRALAERGEIARYRHLKLYAVGDHTADAARGHGFADVTSAGGDFRDLVALLEGAGLTGPVFHPAAQQQAGDLGKALARSGIMVITTRVYEMQQVEALSAPVARALAGGELDAVLHYSRRTAEAFGRLAAGIFPADARAAMTMLCMSEAVAEPLLDAHFVRVRLADHPSEEAMMAMALSFAKDHKRGMIEHDD